MSLCSTYPPSAPTAPRTGISPTMSPNSIYQQTSTLTRHRAHPRRILSCPCCIVVSPSCPLNAMLLALCITSACDVQLCHRTYLHLPITGSLPAALEMFWNPCCSGSSTSLPVTRRSLDVALNFTSNNSHHGGVTTCQRYFIMLYESLNMPTLELYHR